MIALLLVAPLVAGCATNTGDGPEFLGPGARAAALLVPAPYREVEIEVHYSPETPPLDEALEHLENAVRTHTRKEVHLRPAVALDASDPRLRGDRDWSVEEIVQLHRATFTLHSPDEIGANGRIGLHVLILNGRTDADGDGRDAAGLASGNLIAFFRGVLPEEEARTLAPEVYAQRAFEIERAVLVHEFGHVLGLVDHGIPMVRDHGDGTGHSRFRDSVMWPEIETDLGILTLLTGGRPIPFEFDAYDLEDLEAVRTAPPPRAR